MCTQCSSQRFAPSIVNQSVSCGQTRVQLCTRLGPVTGGRSCEKSELCTQKRRSLLKGLPAARDPWALIERLASAWTDKDAEECESLFDAANDEGRSD
ncbi:MAG: hypothetical protein IPK82_13360 [Polyangiaceae bacterium]|nr:hypothetical protein [Polyangiaceae bacterium]